MGALVLPTEEDAVSYSAKVIADSTAHTVRLTTLEVVMPRFLLPEFNTHRVFSRNSASSRAIPVQTRIEQVMKNPFIPEAFGKNKKGMQADELLSHVEAEAARRTWLRARDAAVDQAMEMMALGVHKQHANRILEPYCWHQVVVTATEWENFFNLRTHKDAQPEMQVVARLMRTAMEQSTPEPLAPGDWHLPYIKADEIAQHGHTYGWELLVKLSVARCAAVSYERQNSVNFDADLARYERLRASGHMSPFEHQAQVAGGSTGKPFVEGFSGNFRMPFHQYRKMLRGESVWETCDGE